MTTVMDPTAQLTNAEWDRETGQAWDDVDGLAKHLIGLLDKADPAKVLPALEQEVDAELDRFRLEGVSLIRDDARQATLEAKATKYDKEAAAALIQLHRDLLASEAHFDARWKVSRLTAPEPNPERRDLRTLVIFRMWEGRTHRELLNEYRTSADPTFIKIVEEEPELARLLRLKTDRTDAEAIMGLQAEIKRRQDAREDKAAKAALDRIRSLRSSPSLALLVDQAKRGTLRIARKPQGR